MNLHKLKLPIISFLFTLIPIFNLHAQWESIKFRHLSIEDGLSQSSALCIIQDDIGFIWIGTSGGLNKYDGYNFTVYKSYLFDTTSLSENHILSMYKDHNGVLWLGTEEGFNRFNYSKNTFTRYLHNPDDPNSISNNRVNSICEDSFKELWFGTSNGLCRLNRKRDRFVSYCKVSNNQNSLSCNDVRVVYHDESGTVWIGTYGGGLNKFNRKKNHFKHYLNDKEESNSLSSNYILCVYEDREGILWIGTEHGGLNRFDKANGQFTCYKTTPDNPYSLNDNHVNVIYEDRSGRLWIGTLRGGVSIFDKEKEKFYCYQNDYNNINSLSGNEIISLCEDNTGSIWIGSRGNSISIYNQEAEKFVHYKHEHRNRNSLSDNKIWGIYEDIHGVLWIGTNTGGLNKFDREQNIFTHYLHDNKNPHSIISNMIPVIYEDRFGVLWVGTNEGLEKFNRETGQFIHFNFDPDNPYSISNNRIRCIYEDRLGTLWVGTRGGGLNKFDKETGHFFHYKHEPDDSTSISNNRVYCLYEDRANNFWVGTRIGGLNKLNRETGQFFYYKSDPNNTNSISNNYVTAIHEDCFDNLWIGTLGGGLNKLNREEETFTHYTEKDGLSNNEIYSILEDNNGNLWMSTNRGLSKFNPETEIFKIYRDEDGLQSNEFNTFSAFKSRSGEMFFGGINGFNAFFPDSIKDNPFPPKIVITGFKLANKPVPVGQMPNGRTILEKSISETREITLSYRDKVISFEFAALHYVAPDKNQYAYIMEGLEKEWNYVASNRRFVTYSGLQPGKYVFKVMGSNNDGVWNEEGTSLKITIIPPFWRTWWFYILCVIVVVLIVVIIFMYQINKIKKKKEEEERRKVTETFSQVVKQGRAAVYRRNFDSNVYEYMSEGIEDISGYGTTEITPEFWDGIVVNMENKGELAGLPQEEAFRRFREGLVDLWFSDSQIKTKSGDLRWVMDMSTALRDESGHCYGCLGMVFDITDRKLAEQELARTSGELRLKNEEMEADLNMAREVQMALLSQNYPKNFPKDVPPQKSALQFSHRYIPASELAGDFFEIIPISNHEIGILIYDVMGHGVRASLLTAYLHGLTEELIPIAGDPVAFMKRLNLGLNAVIAQFYAGMFTTAFYLVANIKTGSMQYVNAGHPSPYIIQQDRNNVKKIANGGKKPDPALGLFAEHNYNAFEYLMTKGDTIFFFTDGLYEVEGKNKELFGKDRLKKTIKNQMHETPEKMLDGILDEIKKYAGTSEFIDDVCMVTMHVKQASVL